MKITAIKSTGVTAAEVKAIIEEITEYVSRSEKCDCRVGESCSCGARYVGTVEMLNEGEWVSLSYYGESVALKREDKSLQINYKTCGRTYHSLLLDPASRYITTSTDGKRNSDGWGMANLSETLKTLLKKESGNGWMLESVETSKPEWGIWHWLAGRLQEGPANLVEAQGETADIDPCFQCKGKSPVNCEHCGC